MNLQTFNNGESLASIRTKLNNNFIPKINSKISEIEQDIGDIELDLENRIVDVTAGANINIDKTNPQAPIIGVTPGVFGDVLSEAQNTFSANQNFSEITGVSSEGVVGYWHGGNQINNTTVLDGSPNTKNNGTPTGYEFNNGTVAGTVSIQNEMMKFPGNTNNARLATGKHFINDGNITNIVALYAEVIWDGTTQGIVAGQFRAQALGSDMYGIFTFSSGNTIMRIDNGIIQVNPSFGILNVGQKYKLMAVYDGVNLAVYRDDVLISQTAITGNINNVTAGDNSFTIGNRVPAVASSPTCFNGSISNIRLWNTTFTRDEITAEFNSDLPVKGDGLVLSMSGKHYLGTPSAPTSILDMKHIVRGHSSETSALNFYGTTTNYISLGNVPSLHLLDEKTIYTWFRLNQTGDEQYIFYGREQPANYNQGYHLRIQWTSLRGSTSDGTLRNTEIAGLVPNQWYFASFRISKKLGIQKLNLNITQEAQGATFTGSAVSSNPVYRIGGRSSFTTENLKGQCMVGIVDRYMSDQELINIYNRTKPLFSDNNPAGYTGTFGANEMLSKEGFITFAPNGNRYRISVDNSGNLTSTLL